MTQGRFQTEWRVSTCGSARANNDHLVGNTPCDDHVIRHVIRHVMVGNTPCDDPWSERVVNECWPDASRQKMQTSGEWDRGGTEGNGIGEGKRVGREKERKKECERMAGGGQYALGSTPRRFRRKGEKGQTWKDGDTTCERLFLGDWRKSEVVPQEPASVLSEMSGQLFRLSEDPSIFLRGGPRLRKGREYNRELHDTMRCDAMRCDSMRGEERRGEEIR